MDIKCILEEIITIISIIEITIYECIIIAIISDILVQITKLLKLTFRFFLCG